MPRPIKNNAEYFSHDADMRNDDRIKAVRKKFASTGYAIYNMTLEYLTDKDHFKVELNELNLELMSGDFDEDATAIKEVIEYCIKLDLLQITDGFLRCKSLEKRLEPVLLKRKLAKDRVSVTETTQSKVKKSKVSKYIKHGEGSVFISIRPVYANEKWQRVYELDKFFESTGQLQMLTDSGFTAFNEFIISNPGREFKDAAYVYSSFKKFCLDGAKVQYVPEVKNKASPFSEAEYNRTLWTDQAWRDTYKQQISNNPEFRKHFNLQP
jgi:hypothetical protein